MSFHQSTRSAARASDHSAGQSRQGDNPARAGVHELLNALPVAIYATDAEGRLTFYNDAASMLWGFHPWLGDMDWAKAWKLCDGAGELVPYAQSPLAHSWTGTGEEVSAWRPDGTRVYFVPHRAPLQSPADTAAGTLHMLVDITDRKMRERSNLDQQRQMQVLVREVNHRANNMLATVQAIARMTRSDTVQGYMDAFLGRVTAVSRAHTLLAESKWQGADLRRLLEEELATYMPDHKRRVRGPQVTLRSDMTQSLALIFHELTTNAVRHGALAAPHGHIDICWEWNPDSELSFTWREENGPHIEAAIKPGFGTKLTESAVNGQLGGKVRFNWRRDGLECVIRIPA
jgi:PAS domain S-box-containing protein